MEKLANFTVITKSYLANARVLANALRQRHPEIPFFVFLVDRPDGYFEPADEPFQVILIEEVLPPHLLSTMVGYYTAYELSNALKPFAHLYLAEIKGLKKWFYLDSDVFITGSFDSLFAQLDKTSLLLVPHILRADIIPRVEKLELIFLRTGICNAGCLGINRSEHALHFLHWWKERLIWHCLHNSPGLEADQSWLNFVPSLFPECKFVRDPAVNIAYWNIHERPLKKSSEGRYSVFGQPVVFVHFSGWNWQSPDEPTRHCKVDLGMSKAAWLQAAGDFAVQLQACGIATCSQWPYSFAKAKNGRILTPAMRRNYWAYLRNQGKNTNAVSIFDCPEIFEDPKPKPLSLWGATRMWLGAVKQHFLNS